MRYAGAKRGAGVAETIIANIPYHVRYFDLFAGTGHIAFLKKPAELNYLNDLNTKIIAYLQATAPEGFSITSTDAMILLQAIEFTRKDFIFLDPPYVDESRRSTRKLYTHEMLDPESHTELIQHIRKIKANIMICTKPSALYDSLLSDWRKVSIKTVDRTGGTYFEVIYMNYPETVILHEYTYTGKDKTERYANKATIRNVADKIQNAPTHMKHWYIQSIVQGNPDIAAHFLSTMHTVLSKGKP